MRKTCFYPIFLFLFAAYNSAFASNTNYYLNPHQSNAYNLIWQMEFDLAKKELSKSKILSPSDPYNFFVQNLGFTIELILEGDRNKYLLSKHTEQHILDSLSLLKESTQKKYVVSAVKLHWALVKAIFGDGIAAVWNIRQAYISLGEIYKKNPDFIPASAYYGILNVALSNIPDNYHWAAQLTGLIGNEKKGLELIEIASNSKENNLAMEANIALVLLKSHLEHHRDEILEQATLITTKYKQYNLVSLLVAWLYNKNNNSGEAKALLSSIPSSKKSALITHTMGVSHLQTMEYKLAKIEFSRFLKETKGSSLKKDTYYRLSQIAILEEDSINAIRTKEKIKRIGSDNLFADKYALTMANYPLYNRTFLVAKLYCDGGIFEKSINKLLLFKPSTLKEKAEKNYYLGLCHEKMKDIPQATKYYNECVNYCPKSLFYGPLACVQLIKIAIASKDQAALQSYKTKLNSFKNYDFKKEISEKGRKILSKR